MKNNVLYGVFISIIVIMAVSSVARSEVEESSTMVGWFEIPVSDFSRAKEFYESIFQIQLVESGWGETQLGMFPGKTGTDSFCGAIAYGKFFFPAQDGVVIYLDAGNDLEGILTRVEANGGSILVPKTQVNDAFGFIGIFRDTEGNKIGLRAQ